MVREERVELSTFGSGGRRSIQLSYSRTGLDKSRSIPAGRQPVFPLEKNSGLGDALFNKRTLASVPPDQGKELGKGN